MTYTPPEGVTIGSFAADTLPASFSAPADAVVTYKIYGTSEGTGVETDNLFDIVQYLTKREASYVYVNGYYCFKKDTAKFYVNREDISDYKNKYLLLENNIELTNAANFRIELLDEDTIVIESTPMNAESSILLIPENAKYLRLNWSSGGGEDIAIRISITEFSPDHYIPHGYKIPILNTSGEQQSNYDLFVGDSKLLAEEYVDYAEQKIYRMSGSTLVPTDPPVPLPAINTYKGENTLSSTETLGVVEFTGEWSAIMGSTQAESIDIGFTVDAEEYIAYVTVDDGPSIQVSDTITMPSSADSFTLEVVSWGRERYTETVYSALS